MRQPQTAQRPGSPRNAEVDEKVLATTADLLVRCGYVRLRIDDIAERSGVAKTTIYRRWPSLTSLAVAAYVWLLGDRTISVTTDIIADTESLLSDSFRAFDTANGALFEIGIDLARQGDPGLSAAYRQAILDPLRDRGVALVERGVAEEVFRPALSATDVVDAWVGTIMYRFAMLREPIDYAAARTLAWGLVGRPDLV